MNTGEKDGAREEENGNTFTRWIEMLNYNQQFYIYIYKAQFSNNDIVFEYVIL